jgi:predicted metal-dependent peptidase
MPQPIQSRWDSMTPAQRISAVNIDVMNHKDFCTLTGFVMMGDIHIKQDIPTAGTNGVDVFYGEEFLLQQNRKQLRFVQLHEALHKGLRHCSDYQDIVKKHPQLSNIAMDYVVNALIEQTDPTHEFIEYTTNPEPLLDPKYFNRSFVDVLQDLLKQEPQQQEQEQQTLDDHMALPSDVDKDQLEQDVQDAFNHGEMVQRRLKAGSDSSNNPLNGLGIRRDTDWRGAMREWVQDICAGDEFSRYVPPNKKFLPLGIIMPSHFAMTAGELVLACDTSGSMEPVYPVVFGEIANICKQANPDRVRILWWDTQVCAEQVFNRGQYDSIAFALKPRGGGGTSPACVKRYIETKGYKPTGVIWLTDGYLDASPAVVCSNELWGVVNNDHFKPAHGKTVRIHN